MAVDGDEKRTDLAVERTVLAWWRTGLTGLAVALGVGRLLPELAPTSNQWPYVALGIAFALYATVLFAFGTFRHARDGASVQPVDALLAGAGVVLGIAVCVLIAGG
jgi:putative membrane protein